MKGVMMLFSGAVAGLRNPRAHGFIEEDPERALEFIAFVSLLAKLIKRCDSGEAIREIARTYNVSHSTISRLEP